jgi:RNA polymerase sigma-70 factor (ECF subfamily)
MGVLMFFHWEAPDPLETMVSEEELAELAAAVQGLPPQEGRAVELRFMQGRSAREIADEMGIKESTARATVRSALGRLRRWRKE